MGGPLGLPINARLYRKDPDRTLNDLAAEMIVEITKWFPDQSFQLACDGAYAPLARKNLPRTHVTSRMRRNAAIYRPGPTADRQTRPAAHKGTRLPAPPDLAAAVTDWTRTDVNIRGHACSRLIWSRTLLWYGVCGRQPLLLVVVRDPDGGQADDFLFTTDIHADPVWVASHYAGRWSIEDTFRNTKQFLGRRAPPDVEAPRTRTRPRLVAMAVNCRVAVVHPDPRHPPHVDPHSLVHPQDHPVVHRRACASPTLSVDPKNYIAVIPGTHSSKNPARLHHSLLEVLAKAA